MVLYIDGNYPLHSLHRELVSGLADLGNDVIVYVPTKGKDLHSKYNCDHPKVRVIYSDILNNIDRIAFINKLHKLVSDVEKLVDMSKVDCILAGTMYSDGGVAYLLHKKYDIPFSFAVRETDVTYHMKWRPYLNSFAGKIINDATKVIFLSPSYRKFLDKFRGNQTKYINIPNGVNDYWFKDKDRKRSIHDPVSLIFVGEICKRKNVTTIISAVSELIKSGKTVILNIVGAGNEEQKCRQMVKELGIEDSVHFHGWQDTKEDIKQFYDQSDIFVMPSLRETFGTVYIEALSQGIPVIYTKGQGIDGYFEQGEVGYSCNPLDISEIKNAITDIVNQYQSISVNCDKLSQAFQWKVVAEQYNKVIALMRDR